MWLHNEQYEDESDDWRALVSDEPANLSDRIYARLFRDIASGRYREGERLPAELDLVRQLGASRPVVREALARLRADRIVVSQRGSGSYVARRPESRILEFGNVENIADLARGLEFRIALEGEAAHLAALRRNAEAIAVIDAAAAEVRAGIARDEATSEPDFRFHLAVADATGNALFGSTLRLLRSQILFGMDLARRLSEPRRGERSAVVCGEHDAIARAIREGDAAAARQAMRAHIDFGRTRVLGERVQLTVRPTEAAGGEYA